MITYRSNITSVKVEQPLSKEYMEKQIDPILMLMLLLSGNANALRKLMGGPVDELQILQASYEEQKELVEKLQKEIDDFGDVDEDNMDEYYEKQAKLIDHQTIAKLLMRQIDIISKDSLSSLVNEQESGMNMASSLMKLLLENYVNVINSR